MVIGFVAAILLCIRGCYWYVQKPIYDANPDALLRACRVLMTHRHELHNESGNSRGKPAFLGSGTPEFVKTVPEAVKTLRPAYIAVWKDHVLVCIRALPRTYVLAFSENAKQYGTRRIIDGLWYYNGHSRDQDNEDVSAR